MKTDYKEAKFERITITPYMAKEILETKNVNNRRMNESIAKSYARDMLAGRWDDNNGNTIIFNKLGFLENGQHRLRAVVIANIPIVFDIRYGASVGGEQNGGRMDSLYNAILRYARGREEQCWTEKRTGEIASLVVRMNNGKNKNKVSRYEIIDFIEDNLNLFETFSKTIPNKKANVIGTQGIWTALFLAMANGVDKEYIFDFFEILYNGIPLAKYSTEKQMPIIKLRDYLLQHFKAHGNSSFEYAARTQVALDAFIRKRKGRVTEAIPSMTWTPDILFRENNED